MTELRLVAVFVVGLFLGALLVRTTQGTHADGVQMTGD